MDTWSGTGLPRRARHIEDATRLVLTRREWESQGESPHSQSSRSPHAMGRIIRGALGEPGLVRNAFDHFPLQL